MKWRSQSVIKVKALGLHWRNDALLAAEIYDDAGRVKGVRPLGGEVNFGETWQFAVVREFQEELGLIVKIVGDPIIMENIFTHEREVGHEVVFINEVQFPSGAFVNEDVVFFNEDNGAECVARWFPLNELDTGGTELYPAGLKSILLSDRGA